MSETIKKIKSALLKQRKETHIKEYQQEIYMNEQTWDLIKEEEFVKKFDGTITVYYKNGATWVYHHGIGLPVELGGNKDEK